MVSDKLIQEIIKVAASIAESLGAVFDESDWEFAKREFGRIYHTEIERVQAEFSGNESDIRDAKWTMENIFGTIEARFLGKAVDHHRAIIKNALVGTKNIVIVAARTAIGV